MNRLSHVVLLLYAVLLAAPPQPSRAAPARVSASADSQTPISWVSSLGGSIEGGAVDGASAYLIEGANLTVLDISDPAAPRFRSRAPLPRIAQQVVATNGFVYLLSHNGFWATWIYDVRDPAAPRFVRQLSFPADSSPTDIRLAGGALWLAGWNKVRRFDLGDPAAPVLTGTFACTDCRIQASGTLAYLLDWTANLQVWDLSDPRTPQLRGQTVLADAGSFTGFVLSGSTLYAAGWSPAPGGGSRRSIVTLDVSDPSRPAVQVTAAAEVGELSVAGGGLVTLADSTLRLYGMADPAQPTLVFSQTLDASSFQVAGNTLYAASGRTWSIFELGASGAALRGRFSATLTRVKDVTVEGQRLYAHLPDSLQIVDVSNPLSPTLQARIPMRDTQKPDIDGTRLLVPAADGLRLIDASDPLSPTVRAVLPGYLGQIHGNLAYLITDLGLEIMDIGNPATPVLLGSAPFPTGASYSYDLFVAGGRAYISIVETRYPSPQLLPTSFLTLQVVDVSNPQQPKTGGHISNVKLSGIRERPSGWALSGGALFVALNELRVIDVSDIDSPVLSDYRYDGGAEDVQIVGGRAYVTGLPALSVLDLTDPLHPTTLSRFRSEPGLSSQVRIAGERAYILSDGLRVLDIRSPSTPLPQAMYGSYAARIAVAEPYIYLALNEGGLQIAQIHPERLRQPLLLPLVRRG